MTLPRRRLDPVLVYYVLMGGYAFLFTTVVSVNLIFQTQEAGLNPFQLVLVGAALEATIFLLEVPTGVVADVYSRRLSVLIGLFLVGGGFLLNGAFAEFGTILAAQVVWGCGYTFMSGAQQAWIADEAGVENAPRIYLRTAQIEQLCRIVAIPFSIGVAAVLALNVPILLGGASFLVLGLFLALTMPERGFRRPERQAGAAPWRGMTATFVAGSRLVRGSPLLITVFGITAFYGMASEGFERLWVAHFYQNIGFPTLWHLEPVVWFGVMRTASALLSIAAVELVRRRVDTTSHRAVSRGLFLVNAGQVTSILVLGLAGGFWLAMVAYWWAVSLSWMYDPLYLGWINQNVDSRVRATVLSMSRQTDAIGQIAGGPLLGLVGTLANLRWAFVGTALTLLPALGLYLRAFGLRPEGGAAAADAMGTIAEQPEAPGAEGS